MMLSKQIFVPVKTKDKELMYLPFQCMAQYFLSLGYAGIVFQAQYSLKGKMWYCSIKMPLPQ